MRTTRFILPLVALALCVMPAVALAASGGTTSAIVKDVAKDGKVDGHYTIGAAQVGTQEPAAQAVRRPGRSRVRSHARRSPRRPLPRPATGPSNNLPFTGADVFLFVIVGGGLLAAGLVLRRFGRRDDEARSSTAACS